MELSQVILEYIAARGISYYKIAKATGISESLFSKWKSSPTSEISASNVFKIASYFNTSIDELLGIKVPTVLVDGGQEESIRILNSLPPDKRQEAERYLRYLADTSDKPKT